MLFCLFDAEIPCWMYRTLDSFWRGDKPDQSRNSLPFIGSGKACPEMEVFDALRPHCPYELID
jgi:hypothetical protein